MPDVNTAEAAMRVAGLIREALALADRLRFPMVAIHLDQALGAFEQEARPRRLYSDQGDARPWTGQAL
jgi:hypothetical protein